MSFTNVLAIATPERGDADIAMAAELVRPSNGHVSAFVFSLAAAPPVGEFGGMVSDIWARERKADADRIEARARAVTDLLSRLGVQGDVASDYPEMAFADEVIGRRGRYADLTLVGPDLVEHGSIRDKVVEGALFHSARPLLVVPKDATPTFSPGRIMVAWDSGLEAARAVGAALPMLAGAEAVHVALVDPAEGETAHGAEPGADIAAYLARHGAKVTVDRLTRSGQPVAAILARHAMDIAADLMVMGAYGHSRLRERIFGGVTQSMLDEPPVPILMAH